MNSLTRGIYLYALISLYTLYTFINLSLASILSAKKEKTATKNQTLGKQRADLVGRDRRRKKRVRGSDW